MVCLTLSPRAPAPHFLCASVPTALIGMLQMGRPGHGVLMGPDRSCLLKSGHM